MLLVVSTQTVPRTAMEARVEDTLATRMHIACLMMETIEIAPDLSLIILGMSSVWLSQRTECSLCLSCILASSRFTVLRMIAILAHLVTLILPPTWAALAIPTRTALGPTSHSTAITRTERGVIALDLAPMSIIQCKQVMCNQVALYSLTNRTAQTPQGEIGSRYHRPVIARDPVGALVQQQRQVHPMQVAAWIWTPRLIAPSLAPQQTQAYRQHATTRPSMADTAPATSTDRRRAAAFGRW